MAVSFLYDTKGEKDHVTSKLVITFLSVFFTAYLILKALLLGEEMFSVLVQFLLFINVLKFLGRKEARDYGQIILISFFQMLVGASVTVNVSYGMVLLVFIFFAVATLVLFNFNNEVKGTGNERKTGVNVAYIPFLSSVGVVWMVIVLLGAAMFLLMPRLQGNYLSGFFLKKQQISTGFSEEIELGKIGEIKKDDSPVMRIKFLNVDKKDLPREIYWRGTSLNYFDGRRWFQTSSPDVKRLRKDNEGKTVVDKRVRNDLAKQEIITRPLDTDVIFSADRPVAFQNLPYSTITSIHSSYYHGGSFSDSAKYIAYAQLLRPGPKQLKEVDYQVPYEVRMLYSGKFNVSREIRQLAEDIFNPRATVYENVINVRDYLIRNMAYTRVLEGDESAPPIDHFLFQNKSGHCEYFASSMVVLLREMGIPSRVVTGFLNGEFNEIGDHFLVRESDAHAWVEVYFPEYGWTRFDPTPGDGELFSASSGLSGSFLEFLRYRWSRYVVDFDAQSQRQMFAFLQNKARSYRFQVFDKSALRGMEMIIIIALIAVFSIIAYQYRENFSFFSGSGKQKELSESSRIYSRAVRIIGRKGYVKPGHLTVTEFSDHMLKEGGERFKTFAELSSLFNLVRYCGHSDKDHINRLKAHYDRFRKEP